MTLKTPIERHADGFIYTQFWQYPKGETNIFFSSSTFQSRIEILLTQERCPWTQMDTPWPNLKISRYNKVSFRRNPQNTTLLYVQALLIRIYQEIAFYCVPRGFQYRSSWMPHASVIRAVTIDGPSQVKV